MAALNAFIGEANPLDLEFSWTKTKIQDSRGLLGVPAQSANACSEDIEVMVSFNTLVVYFLTLSCQTWKPEDRLIWQQVP